MKCEVSPNPHHMLLGFRAEAVENTHLKFDMQAARMLSNSTPHDPRDNGDCVTHNVFNCLLI